MSTNGLVREVQLIKQGNVERNIYRNFINSDCVCHTNYECMCNWTWAGDSRVYRACSSSINSMDFVNQIFMDLLAEDGLVVLARFVLRYNGGGGRQIFEDIYSYTMMNEYRPMTHVQVEKCNKASKSGKAQRIR